MLELAIGALLVAIIAGTLGFTGLARGAATVARLVFGIFLVIAIIFMVLALGVSVLL